MKPEYLQKRRAEKRRKQRLTWFVIAAVVLLLILAGILLGTRSSSLPPEITVSQAYEAYQDGALILDVRTQEEWDTLHIPETTLIPLDQLPDRYEELPKNEQIVVICRSGNRSQVGRDILLEAGFKKVTSVNGGVNAWATAGYPVE
jgi:rhodanese-related sulfurtransferase